VAGVCPGALGFAFAWTAEAAVATWFEAWTGESPYGLWSLGSETIGPGKFLIVDF